MKRRNFSWLSADIRVRGECLERFINLAAAKGVRIWDTVITGQELWFKTDIGSLKKLEQIEANNSYAIEVHREPSIRLFSHFVLRRKILVLGFFCFCFVLLFYSGKIWRLEVQGLEDLNREEILEFVEPLGLYKGGNLRKLDLNEIEQQLYLHFPQIAWVAIERTGTRIAIRIVEKEYDPLQSGEPIDIVAQFDGIISEMMVLQGIPMVKPGMTVARGDVLISGYRDNGNLVNAAGSVKAIVYCEGFGEAALEEIERVATGRVKVVQLLQAGKIQLPLSPRKHGFETYLLRESRRYLLGRSNLPIIFREQEYIEIKLIRHSYTLEQAEELARERGMLMAHRQVEEHGDILKTEVRKVAQDDNLIRYWVIITMETRIGQEKVQTRGEMLGE